MRALGTLGVVFVVSVIVTATALGASLNFFEPRSSPEAVTGFPRSAVAADLDGDGDQDLVFANAAGANAPILKNNGAGNFHEPSSSPEPAGGGASSVVAADLDGDGDQDLAVANAASDNVTILRNNGAGNFHQPASSPVPAGDAPRSIVAANLDADGDRDLAVANHDSDNVTILENDGNARFAQPASSPEPAADGPNSVVPPTPEGPGDRALPAPNHLPPAVTTLRTEGAGALVDPASSPEPAGAGASSVAAADLDGDGDQDLAVANFG